MDLQKWKLLAQNLVDNHKAGNCLSKHNKRIHDELWKEWCAMFKDKETAMIFYNKTYHDAVFSETNGEVTIDTFKVYLDNCETLHKSNLIDVKIMAIHLAGHEWLEVNEL